LKKTSVILLLGVLVLLLFPAYPVSAVGVFRNTNGYWSLDYNNTGTTDTAFHFGKTGDIPVVGDWDGQGTIDTGVFRPSTGTWYLDTTRTGTINKTFRFGKTGDIPVVGDWDGEGTIDTGVFRPSTGTWYLDTTRTGTINKTFRFGKTGDMPKALQLMPVAPLAAFTADVRGGYAPLTVRFTSQSTGTAPLSHTWDFDADGESDSSEPSPDYIYTAPGTYTVNLKVSNGAGSDSEQKAGYITVTPAPVPPAAAFTADVREGYAPLTVRFTSQSTGTGPLTYAWDFTNDGTPDSTIRSPLFTYPTAGTYSVTLTVTNGAGSESHTETNYITVTQAPSASRSGIALTFDDNYVDEWYAARNIFRLYNAHVTFCVSQYEGLDEDQIDKLRLLQADGHEIAYHGLHHTDAAAYLENHTIQQYLDYEIIPGINLMQADGFNPVDFSYPFGSGYDNDALAVALQQYFVHLRDTSHGSVYYEYGSGTPMIHAQGIDDTTYGQSMDDLYNYISTAKADDEIVIFYCHEPVPGNPGSYQISYDRLDKVLKNVSENNLKTFTLSEIH
jgi:PKD repeat protein